MSASRPVAVCANQSCLPVLRASALDLNSEIFITCLCLWCKLLWRSSLGTKYFCWKACREIFCIRWSGEKEEDVVIHRFHTIF
jgi:hypothetical protein